jgi:hypothetical protein
VLDALLAAVEVDEAVGPLLRAAGVRTRFEFTDMDLALNVASAAVEDRNVDWDFAEAPPWEPNLTMAMESQVANRWLQGTESVAIAIARGRVRCAGEARSALFFLPAMTMACGPYRRLIAASYPHLRLPPGL